MKILTRENIPCWYELSWNAEVPAIVLKIHKDFIEHKGNIPNNAPIILGFKETFSSFGDFKNDFQGDIGFGGVFRHYGEDGEFIKFAVDIPIIQKKINKPCNHCNGSGNDEIREDKCLFCYGSGRKIEMNWNVSYSISASFTTLFTFFHIAEQETKCEFPQLLEVDTMTRSDMHGGWSLGGRFSIPLVNWLKTFDSSKQIPEIKEATMRAYKYMFYKNTVFNDFCFKVNLGDGNGRLIIDCPGDACGIHPSDFYDRENKGYEFSCHNVDGPAQQLTLLAGLAALHDKARKEIKSY